MGREEFLRCLQKMGVDKDNLEAFDNWECRNSKLEELLKLINDLMNDKFRVLTILGTQGVGKSYTVAKGVEDYLKGIYLHSTGDSSIQGLALFLTHFELDLAFKECMNPRATNTQSEIYNKYCNTQILVVDEIGRGSWSDYSSQFIENVISKRYANGKRTILISNKTTKELSDMFDSNIIDRLSNNTNGKIWVMKGESQR